MQRVCEQCKGTFDFTEEDQTLLEKLSPVYNEITYSLSIPKLCPQCRYQRRLALRNESKLYKRKCDFTGEDMISLYPPDCEYTVYKEEVWWGDEWDGMNYGREFDFTRPFFDQFNDLRLAVPRRGMQQDGTSENCEYATYGMGNRSCYMAFACALAEDCYHCTWCLVNQNCTDCHTCYQAELMYECVSCHKSYNCYYSYDCSNIQDSYFLRDCVNCHHCIGCKNLRGKSYHIYNEPVTKEEFEKKKAELHAGGFEKELEKFNEWQKSIPTLYAHIDNCENCEGNNLENARNCKDCYDVILGAEDCRHCQFCGWKGNDMMDCCNTGKEAEMVYETMATITSQRAQFVMNCQTSSNVMYCEGVKHLENCFGCIGITHKKFCILNKEYTEEEFYELIPKIVDHMKKHGEWGENFPIAISAFGYNETLAPVHFPLTREEVLGRGWKWCDKEDPIPNVEKIIPASRLPDTIADIPDDILNWAIECRETGRPYRIIAQELAFYRNQNIPIPTLHPEVRAARRAKLRAPHKLWEQECEKCSIAINSPYAPSTPDILYCEACYLAETYGEESGTSLEEAAHSVKVGYKNIARKAGAAKRLLQAKAKKKD